MYFKVLSPCLLFNENKNFLFCYIYTSCNIYKYININPHIFVVFTRIKKDWCERITKRFCDVFPNLAISKNCFSLFLYTMSATYANKLGAVRSWWTSLNLRIWQRKNVWKLMRHQLECWTVFLTKFFQSGTTRHGNLSGTPVSILFLYFSVCFKTTEMF